MPGRKYSNGGEYRYGFNGKENDKDAGEGVQDYGLRVYDSRLGKFLSVDPLTKSYPHYTPYSFAGNKPIQFIDLDGGEEKPFNSPGNMEPIGKVQSYVTQEGADARIYNVKEMGKTYTIARMVTYKTAQNNTQSSRPVITYLVKDPNLINPSNVSSGCNTLFTTAGTNWHYWQTNQELSQSQEVTKNSLKQFGTGVFAGAVAFAAVPAIAYIGGAPLIGQGSYTIPTSGEALKFALIKGTVSAVADAAAQKTLNPDAPINLYSTGANFAGGFLNLNAFTTAAAASITSYDEKTNKIELSSSKNFMVNTVINGVFGSVASASKAPWSPTNFIKKSDKQIVNVLSAIPNYWGNTAAGTSANATTGTTADHNP